ncbi:hypothetical protein Taro_029717 [Colocasia esculenta]|uniref:PHD finger protein ALFIN-LIKE n=1 Tax=Colocasia esculenta TaxID=4460 RepID=A0A843VEI0_COLES|nr:hypothetical protein [Colocasia esculenta]
MEMASSNPRSVEDIFKDYSGRRNGIVRALTYGELPFPSPSLSLVVQDPGAVLLVPKFCTFGVFLSLIYLRSVTPDVNEFYALCDPEKENLCLYGHPNDTWEVNLPAEEVPPELPEPALGINFARDGMNRKDWLSLVAVHSDSWLLSVAFYLGARFNRNERSSTSSIGNRNELGGKEDCSGRSLRAQEFIELEDGSQDDEEKTSNN